MASADAVADAISKWRRPQGLRRLAALLVIGALLAGTGALVYATGGTRYAYLHAAYIPIVFGALFFGIVGSVATAIIAALVIGPWMPLNVALNLPQPPMSWGVRGLFLVGFAIVAGLLIELLNKEIAAVRRLAYVDVQTGLPNQTALLSELRQKLDRNTGRLLLILVELGRFDQLKATFGPERLDTLVNQAVQRLQQSVSAPGKLFRTGPFQFAIVTAPTTSDQMELLTTALHAPADCDGIPVDLEASAGAAYAPEHGTTSEDLIRAAAAALYSARTSSSSMLTFDTAICAQQLRSFGLVSELRQALHESDLQLYYQPKVDLRTGRCVGAEALLRWHHREHGVVSPGDFIPYVEQTTLINDLTHWAINTTLHQVALWREARLALSVAVNLATRNLDNAQLPAEVAGLLHQHGLPGGALQVEITETAIMRDPTRSANILRELQAIGVGVAIDDFGSGQSSLTYLASLPVNEIKLDKGLVGEITRQPRYDHVVCSAIELGHRLGMTVTAEGVESRQVADRLRRQGCDLAQGYFFARPMPAAAFETWLRERGSATAPAISAPA